MINPETVEQIQQAPVAERLHIVELILKSLKRDMHLPLGDTAASQRPFAVRQFGLGQDVRVDRDELYADRGI